MSNRSTFLRYVPEKAADYCTQLWTQHQFTFRITQPRKTKLGDFRAEPGKGCTITVNNNLNTCAFLITYLHEVAHLLAYQQWIRSARRRRLQPHGSEWQKAFHAVMQPVLNESVFPDSVLVPLIDYLRSPAASTGAHSGLTKALRQLDSKPASYCLLIDLGEGEPFRFSEKEYVRGMKRRTRIVCTEKDTNRRVSVWAHVWVEKI
ncbi:SprT-like domain-containing protein [Tellurirhabdus bombi]|uniref:SprT-like domain-containing protein n=1 Tax=Tellurirhabdus bombi TaxID=2907205 RepID=UPI001F3B0861|nr:SprT-like domain-containing protein [Tellurirhabdus bombi]